MPTTSKSFPTKEKIFDFTDEDRLKYYRLSRAMIVDIVASFAESEMSNKTLRSHALCAETLDLPITYVPPILNYPTKQNLNPEY